MKKILLIGDSIRKGYDKYVELAMEDVAKVYYPNENCRFAAYVLRHLPNWKKELELGDDVDCIHWNAGLWDDLHQIDGKPLTDIALYKEYIERICHTMPLLFPNATFIFATSTAVQEDKYNGYFKRYNCETEEYNAAAIEIVTRYGHKINDLYALTKDMPKSFYTDCTHFYTKEGTKLSTEAVLRCLEADLGVTSKPLDYDALFTKSTNVVGI
ncbi:MAG: SGNH/GDSL hydrolase family protein [Clostridia bacterium]|nr:SGNH/GDSL hydrolase family protein [Clostridia bacterium]